MDYTDFFSSQQLYFDYLTKLDLQPNARDAHYLRSLVENWLDELSEVLEEKRVE
jgi:hypothetical protein